jgi:AcrR family transcriptional regulator
MVYYYFPTKDDLFLAIVEEVYQVVLADLLVALEPSQPVPLRIRRLYERVGRFSDEERMVLRLVLREALISSSRLDSIVERFQNGHMPLVIRLIQDGLADGTFESSIPPMFLVVSMMALGGPGQLIVRALQGRSPFPPPADGIEGPDRMLGILLRGIAAKPAAGDDHEA